MSGLPNHPNLFPSEVAKFLRISISTLYDMLNEGQLPAIKVNNQWRIPRDKFLKWYETGQSTNLRQNFLSA